MAIFSLVHDFLTIPLPIFEAYLHDPKLNDMLVTALNLDERKLINKESTDKDITWVFLVKKSSAIPEVLKKWFKDGLSWQETSRFVRDEHCIYWEIKPISNVLKFYGEGLCKLSSKNHGCQRVIEGKVCVDIPLIGKAIEPLIVKELIKQYDIEPAIQEQFYQEMI